MMRILLKKIIKRLLLLFLAYLVIILIAFGYFLIKKNRIAEVLLLSINDKITGEIVFNDISFHPFKQFPSVSVVLEDFNFYEKPDSIHSILDNPVAEFKNVYIAFDIIDLLEKKITVTKVIFENGYIDLIKYPDGKYNLIKALDLKKIQTVEKKRTQVIIVHRDTSIKVPDKKPKQIKQPEISKTLKLKLDKIRFVNTSLTYNNQKNGRQAGLLFHELQASLSLMPDSITAGLNFRTEIKKVEFANNYEIGSLEVKMHTSLTMNRKDSLIKIESSKLQYKGAEFKLDGILDFKKDGLVDFNIKGLDEESGLFSLLLTESGIDNLTSGRFKFKGNFKGKLTDEIPALTLDFGIEDLSLKVPGGSDSIRNFNLHGTFESGNKDDFSLSVLKIDTLDGLLPGGYINGNLEVENFVTPKIIYKIDLLANIAGLDNVLQQNYVDSLDGNIEFRDEFKGVLNPKRGWVDEKNGNLRLKFDKISLQVPGWFNLDKLNGSITNKYNKIQLNKITLRSGKSDLEISGVFRNLTNLIFDEGKTIVAQLSFNSGKFDFSDFLFDKEKNPIPYQFRNTNIEIIASTTHDNLFKFNQAPKINFSIKKFDTSIDSLVNPFSIKKGNIILSEKNNKVKIDFKDIDFRSANGRLLINGKFTRNEDKNSQMGILLNAKRLNIRKMVSPAVADSNFTFLNNNISGHINIKLNFSSTDSFRISYLEIKSDSLTFKEGKGAIHLKSVKLVADSISYPGNIRESSLAGLNAKIELKSKKVISNYYRLNDLIYKIDVEKGVFTVNPVNDTWFGTKAKGKFILSPFKNPPVYFFDYSVKQFSTAKMFTNFMEDSLMTGKMDLDLRLSFSGNRKDSILKSIKGRIRVIGNDLTLYGLNIDEFLKNLLQKHNFNLLDIGLVVYTGPLALIARKGSNNARIEITDRGKTTYIGNMVSDWKIRNDSLIAEDVAFTTDKNRIALKGMFSYKSDSINFNVGLLDQNGCSIINQQFVGLLEKPRLTGFNPMNPAYSKALIQSKSNVNRKCVPFYKGSLVHPAEDDKVIK